MNTLFNINKLVLSMIYKNLLIFMIIVCIMKASSLVLLHFLPASGITKSIEQSRDIGFISLRVNKIFGLKSLDVKKRLLEEEEQKKEEIQTFPLTALKLKAIFHSRDLSFVTLDDVKGVLFLDIGESFKGYTLHKVYAKKAIFTRDNKKYELSIEDETDKRLNTTKKIEKKRNKATSKETVQSMSTIPRDEIKTYQKDMSKIWSNIGLKEHKSNGVLEGFIVTFVKDDSVFKQLGLQKDDILTEANGIQLKSYKDALNLYKKIDTIKVFKLTIKRDNEEKELEYEIF